MLTAPLLTIYQEFSTDVRDPAIFNLRILRVHDIKVRELSLQLSEQVLGRAEPASQDNGLSNFIIS